MSREIEGLVESSTNLGVVKTEGARVEMVCCSRSSVMSKLAELVEQHLAIGVLAGAEVELVNELARESRLRKALEPIAERYEYLLVDCPPSLGLLTLNGLVAALDGVIIPVQCEYLALEGLGQLTQTLERVRTAIYPDLQVRGVVLTMFDARTNLSNDVVAEVRRHFPGQVFKSVIPRSVRLAEAPSYGVPISVYAPKSSGGGAYQSLANEMLAADTQE